VADVPRPITGRCLCGGVTYSVDAEPVWQGICHCSNCQRQTASAFSPIVGVPSEALAATGDTLASFETVSEGYESKTVRRFSTIESMPGLAFLKAGTIDDLSWFEPSAEIWTGSAQPWTPHFEGAAQFETVPDS
jgi:hypothetical protein